MADPLLSLERETDGRHYVIVDGVKHYVQVKTGQAATGGPRETAQLAAAITEPQLGAMGGGQPPEQGGNWGGSSGHADTGTDPGGGGGGFGGGGSSGTGEGPSLAGPSYGGYGGAGMTGAANPAVAGGLGRWGTVGLGALNTGLNLAGGLIASNAAHNAAQAQIDASTRALALATEIYHQQQQNEAPYMAAGQRALGRLADFQPWTQQFVPGRPRSSYGMSQTPTAGVPGGPALGTIGSPPPAFGLGGPLNGTGTPAFPAPPAPQSQALPPPNTPQDTVMLRAPDGTVRPVPAQYADAFIKKGAVRIA